MPYIADDALITLRYVDRFLDGLGLTWNDGIRVEGYSNFLWAMLISLLGYVGLDLVLSVRLLGFLFSISSLFLLLRYISNKFNQNYLVISIIVILLFSLSSVISIWTIAGLEQPLFCFLVLASILNYLDYKESNNKKYLWIASITLGLISITRPDGLLFSMIIAIYHLFTIDEFDIKHRFKTVLQLAIFPTLLFSVQLIFRIYYYNELVPNTALVKIAPSFHHLLESIIDSLKFVKSSLSLFILALISVYISLKYKSKNIKFYLFTLIIWVFYLSFVGDIFLAFRHHYTTILILLLIISDGINQFLGLKFFDKYKYQFILMISFLLLFFSYQQITNVNYSVVKLLNWHWETKTLSDELKIYFGDHQPLIAVDAAGSLPYFTRFPSLDMLGLNDYHIARNKPDKIGQGQVGHELGDDEYILNLNPDIIQIHISYDVPIHYADSLLFKNEKFNQNYIDVGLLANGVYTYKGILWFNKNSDIVGIHKTDKSIEIPAYLFRSQVRNYSEFNSKHKIITPVKKGDTLIFTLPFGIDYRDINIEPNNNNFDVWTNNINSETIIYLTNKSDNISYIEKVIIY